MARDAVSRTLDCWEAGGLAALEEGARSGRPLRVEAALEAEIFAAAAQPACADFAALRDHVIVLLNTVGLDYRSSFSWMLRGPPASAQTSSPAC